MRRKMISERRISAIVRNSIAKVLRESINKGYEVIGEKDGDAPIVVVGTTRHKGKYNFVSPITNTTIGDVWYDDVTDFKNGVAYVNFEGDEYFIDENGDVADTPKGGLRTHMQTYGYNKPEEREYAEGQLDYLDFD